MEIMEEMVGENVCEILIEFDTMKDKKDKNKFLKGLMAE